MGKIIMHKRDLPSNKTNFSCDTVCLWHTDKFQNVSWAYPHERPHEWASQIHKAFLVSLGPPQTSFLFCIACVFLSSLLLVCFFFHESMKIKWQFCDSLKWLCTCRNLCKLNGLSLWFNLLDTSKSPKIISLFLSYVLGCPLLLE